MILETSNAFLEYHDKIVYVRLKEGAEITIDSMREQYSVQEALVGNDTYTVLVDARNSVTVPGETRKYMAAYNPRNRKATAILTHKNLATRLIANYYLNFNKPSIRTRIFNNEDKALNWLKKHIS